MAFLYLPMKIKCRLDLTLVLLAWAVRRGLFPGGLKYALETRDSYLKVDPAVNEQAVFVASNQLSEIYPSVPLGHGALNFKTPRKLYCCRTSTVQHDVLIPESQNRAHEARTWHVNGQTHRWSCRKFQHT